MDQPELRSKSRRSVENFNKPSVWYKDAKDTVIYRLSELIFGSLLASFVLGFVGFSGFYLSETVVFSQFMIKALTYLFISATYSYYTAGLYLYYHTGILTMPTYAFKKAARDFAFSLAPAVAFGFSMLKPELLPITLSIVISISLFIHNIEQRRLVSSFVDKYYAPRWPEGDWDMRHQHELKKKDEETVIRILAESKLTGWVSSSKSVFWGIIALAVLGLFLAYFVVDPNYLNWNIGTFDIWGDTFILSDVVLLGVSSMLFFFVYFKLKEVFDLASKFNSSPSGISNYDEEYRLLIERFKKPSQ